MITAPLVDLLLLLLQSPIKARRGEHSMRILRTPTILDWRHNDSGTIAFVPDIMAGDMQ